MSMFGGKISSNFRSELNDVEIDSLTVIFIKYYILCSLNVCDNKCHTLDMLYSKSLFICCDSYCTEKLIMKVCCNP